MTNATAQKEQESLKNAVVQSAVHCYSVEGAYPDSLDYLKKHYGITWDESKYKVTYEIIAKNIRPEVKVIPLQESKNEEAKLLKIMRAKLIESKIIMKLRIY